MRNLPRLKQYIAVFHSPDFPHRDLLDDFEGFSAQTVSKPQDITVTEVAILILDSSLVSDGNDLAQWMNKTRGIVATIAEEGVADVEFVVPNAWPKSYTLKALENAMAELTLRLSRRSLRDELISQHEKIFQLTNIGLALTAETNLNRLLTMILTEGRNLASCDAASLFLIEKNNGKEELIFKLTQNDSISFPFEEKRFPLDKKSIAGFVAVEGEILNIPDVYRIPTESPYGFNSSFDETMNYRSRSMLAIPMKNHQREVIGVLQFLNRKTDPHIKLASTDITLKHTLPFSEELANLLKALASQAAVAIENSVLISRINHLFEGFVSAAVTAIEQRDPTTSGHSFRVADLTTKLALATPKSHLPRFASLSFSDVQIKEIRYASLLHDFGKVGVREPVLVKAKKLPESGLDLIWSRFAIFKERLRRMDAEKRLSYILEHGRDNYQKHSASFDSLLEEELQRFSRFYDEIAKANNPTILPEGRFSHLAEIKELGPFQVEEREVKLLEEAEFLALSVRKGTLTPTERKEIESHVVHTYAFLKRIPWTPDLQKVPYIAVAHHEKLDGSGYPYGLKDEAIPLPSKMMAIADIFDALTASDRPYKRAMPAERALGILEAEAGANFLDEDLVRVFIESKIYQNISDTSIDMEPYPAFSADVIKRNTCDFDITH